MFKSAKSKYLTIDNHSYRRHTNSESSNTTEESLLKFQPSTMRSQRCYPKINSTFYCPQMTQPPSTAKNHSILFRFQRELKTQLISAIDNEISHLSQTQTSFRKAVKAKVRISKKKMILNKQDKDSEIKKQLNTMPIKPIKALNISEENDHSLTFDEPSAIKNPKVRIRILNETIRIDPKWKKELGVHSKEIITEKCLITDLKYQSHYIKDQMKLLLDNTLYYKVTILSSNVILSALKNKSIKLQMNHNKLLEEQCVLFHRIPKKLLKDFYNYVDKFISIVPVELGDHDQKEITDEADCFVEDGRMLNQLFTFLKCAFDVYLILVKEVDCILLSPKEFNYLANIIQKARFNMNVIITTSRNWISDFNFDRNLIASFKAKVLESNSNIDSIKKDNHYKGDFITDVIHKQLHLKKNDEVLKLQRINNAIRKKKKKSEQEKQNEEKAKEQGNGQGPIMSKALKSSLTKHKSIIVSIASSNLSLK